jgi:hypothetical protein
MLLRADLLALIGHNGERSLLRDKELHVVNAFMAMMMLRKKQRNVR